MNENEFQKKRNDLVRYLKETQAITHLEIEKAFLEIPRETFVSEGYKEMAYLNDALPSEKEQTISQPQTIAIILELLQAEKNMNVLEIGSGTGYVMALLSKIVGEKGNVYGIELEEALVEKANERLKKLQIKNAQLKQGDGALGWKEKSPFDRILVSCSCPFVPPELFKQLKEKGKIVAPVGDSYDQQLLIIEKFKGKMIKKMDSGGLYQFVPLRSKTIQKNPQELRGIKLDQKF